MRPIRTPEGDIAKPTARPHQNFAAALPNFLTFQLSTILIAYAQIPPDLNAVVDTSVTFFCIAIAALMMKFYRFEMRPRWICARAITFFRSELRLCY
jgi:hypothetical protein